MKFKRHSTNGILLIIAIIIMTADCGAKKGGPSGSKKSIKSSIMQYFTMSPKTYNKWQSNSLARKFSKAIRYTPIVKENDYNKLLDLLSNEADAIKIGAFKKLSKMYSGAITNDDKKKLILAKLQGTIELIKSYGVIWSCPMVKYTFAEGLYYAHNCNKLHKENPGECLKKKMQLYSAFILSHKIEMNRLTRYFLSKTTKEAEKYFPKGDRTLKFINIKVACEIKLAQENKNSILKKGMEFFMGGFEKYDCVNELLGFESHLKEIDSYPGEYYYLLARAYGKQNNNELALNQLRKARKAEVVDSKTRNANKKVQAYYEKIYTHVNTVNTNEK